MENKKDKILKNIKRAETELSLEELSRDEMLEKIAHYKTLSLKACEQIQSVSWKISQADFIRCCEGKKQTDYLRKIERSNLMARRLEIPNRSENKLHHHVELLESLSARLETLRRGNVKKMESISYIEKELDTLKKRNDSILQKLMKDLEERENEERQLEDNLEQI